MTNASLFKTVIIVVKPFSFGGVKSACLVRQKDRSHQKKKKMGVGKGCGADLLCSDNSSDLLRDAEKRREETDRLG